VAVVNFCFFGGVNKGLAFGQGLLIELGLFDCGGMFCCVDGCKIPREIVVASLDEGSGV
jgi:hypothetical protein